MADDRLMTASLREFDSVRPWETHHSRRLPYPFRGGFGPHAGPKAAASQMPWPPEAHIVAEGIRRNQEAILHR